MTIGNAHIYSGGTSDGYTDASSAWVSEDSSGPHETEIFFPKTASIGDIHLYTGLEDTPRTQMTTFEVAYRSGSDWIPFQGVLDLALSDAKAGRAFSGGLGSEWAYFDAVLFDKTAGLKIIRDIASRFEGKGVEIHSFI